MSGIIRDIVAACGGEMRRGRGFIPGPGHSRHDRSVALWPSPTDPNDYLCHSYSPAHDWREVRDYIDGIVGLSRDRWRRRSEPAPEEVERRREAVRRAAAQARVDARRRRLLARDIWHASREPRGTVVERYLNSRGLDLPGDLAGPVIRFHPQCPWKGGAVLAMVTLMRDTRTGDAKAIHRTALTPDGRKVDRRMLADAIGCAAMLDPFEDVAAGLALGEGIESCLSARQLGIRPVWAACTSSMVKTFPVLPGIEALTLLVENDANGASDRACTEAGTRWHEAGRAVDFVRPRIGKDLNDVLREGIPA